MSVEVKLGYKQTKLGIIPEDWDVSPLGQLVHAVEYGSSAKSSSSGKVPVLRMGNIQEGKIDWSDLVFTDNENEITKYLLTPGDVLFNRTNTVDLVGKTAIYRGGRPSIFAGYLIKIKEKKGLIDSRYLNYFLNSDPAKNYGLKVLSVAVGQANINGQKLKTYPIPLPPTIDEQNSIATAISDMEELISGLDQLIAKKRDIQIASIQQLLTGQHRLPGFSGVWEVKRLGDLCKLGMGRTPSRSNSAYWGSGYKWLSIANLKGKVVSESSEQVTELAAKQMALIPKGTLLMSFKLSIGRLAFAGCDLFTNEAICSFNDLKANAEYLYYALQRVDFSLYGKQAVKGFTLNKASLQLVEVAIPAIEEQTAIATIISDMDTELTALETRRSKARQLKQGMMQELLTGRIRLA